MVLASSLAGFTVPHSATVHSATESCFL